MKKALLIASTAFLGLMSCNNDANDGDAATDTMNTTGNVPTSAAPYGDTAHDVNNQGTKTNLNMRTDVDSFDNQTNYTSRGKPSGGGQSSGGNQSSGTQSSGGQSSGGQ